MGHQYYVHIANSSVVAVIIVALLDKSKFICYMILVCCVVGECVKKRIINFVDVHIM